MVNRPLIIILTGPTAVGKTDLAVELTKRFPLGLVSVDALQIYKGLNIGTAKPTPSILAEYPHALIDIRTPDESYSAGEFCRESVHEIRRIWNMNEIPMLVGGTMFYFSALNGQLDHLPGADYQIRSEIEAVACKVGWNALHEQLWESDPQLAKGIHRNDRQRIQRALELQILKKRSNTGPSDNPYVLPPEVQWIRMGLAFSDRSILHKRIEARVDRMLYQGLIYEVENLISQGLDPKATALRSVGYRHVCQHLRGDLDYSTMRERIIQSTRQFAKRQLTWMRNTPGTVWFNSSDQTIVENAESYLRSSIIC